MAPAGTRLKIKSISVICVKFTPVKKDSGNRTVSKIDFRSFVINIVHEGGSKHGLVEPTGKCTTKPVGANKSAMLAGAEVAPLLSLS